jgi:peptidoglycan/xylan/chitin deacetylase (PgdA/CDA1 family)
VLLTFDDGPHPQHTPALLDRLALFGVRAAFFLVGKRIVEPRLIARIQEEGHMLGNHTFSHSVPSFWKFRGVYADVKKSQDLIPDAALFRPPLGHLTPALWWAARGCGLECIGWTLDSGDWRCRSEADAHLCANEVLHMVRPGDILLFHDDHPWILPIMDVVLQGLADRGFTQASRNRGIV